MSEPPPKTSEVLTGSSMQIKISNGNIWAKKLGKMKYFPKIANVGEKPIVVFIPSPALLQKNKQASDGVGLR